MATQLAVELWDGKWHPSSGRTRANQAIRHVERSPVGPTVMGASELMPNRAIRFLAELGLRVNDLARMTAFYRDLVGLDVFGEGPGYVFFRVAEALEGHPQLIVLFDRDSKVDPATTTLDHLAFLIDLEDYDGQRRRLEGFGVDVSAKEFPEFHWRSLFFTDPEGNRVEFVAYDR
ncbi:MAG: VOC family protein, partial [Candidatus Dormibacteria bacterium]